MSFYRLLWNRSLFQRNSLVQTKPADSIGILPWKEEDYGRIDFSLQVWSRNRRVPASCMFGSFVLTSVPPPQLGEENGIESYDSSAHRA